MEMLKYEGLAKPSEPGLFLDLDGTVRFSKNGRFINGPDDVALYNGVEELIWEYKDKGYLIFGITNQGGVAFGYKTEGDNEKEIAATVELFDRNPFDMIHACYFHPDGTVEPYNRRSLLRKPEIGMLALCELNMLEIGIGINWDESLFVGDRPEDEQCAKNAGIAFQWAHDFCGREPES